MFEGIHTHYIPTEDARHKGLFDYLMVFPNGCDTNFLICFFGTGATRGKKGPKDSLGHARPESVRKWPGWTTLLHDRPPIRPLSKGVYLTTVPFDGMALSEGFIVQQDLLDGVFCTTDPCHDPFFARDVLILPFFAQKRGVHPSPYSRPNKKFGFTNPPLFFHLQYHFPTRAIEP